MKKVCVQGTEGNARERVTRNEAGDGNAPVTLLLHVS